MTRPDGIGLAFALALSSWASSMGTTTTGVVVALGQSSAPCLEAAGAAIRLDGNGGFCYLRGQRMRPHGVYAICRDGALTCYADDGIPDRPRREVPCVAPEPGHCGAPSNATIAPSSSSPPPQERANNNNEDGEDNDDDNDEEVDATVNRR